AHREYGVRFLLLGVLEHALEGLGAGFFTHLFVSDDIAAQDLGEAAAAALAYGLGPHDDAAHHAEVRGDAVTGNVVGRGDKHGNLPSALRERRRILAVTALKGQTESWGYRV